MVGHMIFSRLYQLPNDIWFNMLLHMNTDNIENFAEVYNVTESIVLSSHFAYEKVFHDYPNFQHLKHLSAHTNIDWYTVIYDLLNLSITSCGNIKQNFNCDGLIPDIALLKLATINKCIDVVKLLLLDKTIVVNIPEDDPEKCRSLIGTASWSTPEIFDLIYNDHRAADLEKFDPKIYMVAAQNGNLQGIIKLLHDPRTTQDDIETMVTYSIVGDNPETFILTAGSLKNLSFGNNLIAGAAAAHNNVDVFKILFSDPRFNLGNDATGILLTAINYGSVEVVKFLLDDPRFDPSPQGDYPIHLAAKMYMDNRNTDEEDRYAEILSHMRRHPRYRPVISRFFI